MAVLKTVQKMIRPITLQLSLLGLFNCFVAGFLVFSEYKSAFTIEQKLMELEAKLESGTDLENNHEL